MKVLRVNMRERNIVVEEDKYPGLGGRGYCVKRILEEVPADCEPLGRNNKLVITAGLLNNLGISGAERLSIGSKSPLTGGIKESNSGGVAALALSRQGYKAIIVEDIPLDKQLFILLINHKDAKIVSASEYKGMGNYELAEKLLQKYGEKHVVISNGPAGEALLLTAGIAVTDSDGRQGRFAARGGLGAVMGAKGLKAIVINNEDIEKPQVKDRKNFKACLKEYRDKIRANPTTGSWFNRLGTAGMVNFINSINGLPLRNFSCGKTDKADLVAGETIGKIISQRGGEGRTGHHCMPGCLVRCSKSRWQYLQTSYT